MIRTKSVEDLLVVTDFFLFMIYASCFGINFIRINCRSERYIELLS